MRKATLLGHRPCPARDDYVEIVVAVDRERVNWCLPGRGDADDVVPLPPFPRRLELRCGHRDVQLLEYRADGTVEPLGVARAVALLRGGHTELFVDDRFQAVHQ